MKRRLGLLLALAFGVIWLPFAAAPCDAALAAPGYARTVAGQAEWDALATSGLAANDTILLTGNVVHASTPLTCQSITVAQGGSLTLRGDLNAGVTVQDGGRYVLESGQQTGDVTQTGGEITLQGKVSGSVRVQSGTLHFCGGDAQLPDGFHLGSSGGGTIGNNSSATAIEVLTLDGQRRIGTLVPGQAFAYLPAPQNPRWDGTTMRWDTVAHATEYQFYVHLQTPAHSTGSFSKCTSNAFFDCMADLQQYAPNTFTFEVAAVGGTVGDTIYLSSNFSVMSAPLAYPQRIAFTGQPAGQQVPSGGSAHFRVGVTGDAPVYQWQVKAPGAAGFADVPGANDAALQLLNVTRAMHGNQYRCVVQNAQGEAVSQPAALTVYATAELAALQVHGLAPGQSIAAGTDAHFTVTGPNMQLTDPHTGDERLRPTAYRIFARRADGRYEMAVPLTQGALSTPGYGAALDTRDWAMGDYVLFLSCVLERYENGQWTDVGSPLPAHAALQFAIAPAESVLSPTQGPASTVTPAPEQTVSPDGSAPSTGERGLPAAMPIALIALAAVVVAAALYFGRKRMR